MGAGHAQGLLGEHGVLTPLQTHVRDCRACSCAMLGAIFAARPFVDTSAAAARLDEMCNRGKELAAREQAAKQGIELA